MFGEHLVDEVWHADAMCVLVVVPIDGHTTVKGATPVNGDLIQTL